MSMTWARENCRGSSLLEFTLVGIPLIFLLISIFEISRGMWIYHTLAHAIKEGTRYASVHGQDCATSPNSCAVTVADVAARIRDAGVGLIPTQFQNITLGLAVPGSPTPVNPVTCSTLDACLQMTTTYWPSGAPGQPINPMAAPGMDVLMSGQYPFSSAIALLWPGAKGIVFPTFLLPASSRERIHF